MGCAGSAEAAAKYKDDAALPAAAAVAIDDFDAVKFPKLRQQNGVGHDVGAEARGVPAPSIPASTEERVSAVPSPSPRQPEPQRQTQAQTQAQTRLQPQPQQQQAEQAASASSNAGSAGAKSGRHDADTMMKISELMQKVSDARSKQSSHVQVLKHVLDTVVADCSAAYACIQTINAECTTAMIVTTVSAPSEYVEKHRLLKLDGQESANESVAAAIAQSRSYIEWNQGGTQQPQFGDWRSLAEVKPLFQLSAVPIFTGDELIGVLTLGVETEEAAGAIAWQLYMRLVTTTINMLIKDNVLKYMQVIQDVREATQLDALVHKLIGHLHTIVGVNNRHIWYRVALANTSASCATIFDDLTQLPPAGGQGASASNQLVQMAQANGGVLRSVVNMKNTVMKISMGNRQQVMIPDVQKLTNQSGYVFFDIFNTRLMKPPTSLLVFPLKVRHGVYGVIFCMSPLQTDFTDMSLRLKELCEVMTGQLLQTLTGGGLKEDYSHIQQATADTSASGSAAACAAGGLTGSLYNRDGDSSSCLSGSSFGGLSGSMAHGMSTTGALVTGLTEKLNQKRMKSAMDFSSVQQLEELQLQGLLGEGGFAKVFKGLLQNIVVAVKIVMEQGSNEKNVLKNAHEIAILSTLSHPHVTLAYLCLTDIEVRQLAQSVSVNPSDTKAVQVVQEYLGANEDRMCHVVVLEFCDLGSLLSSLRNKVFIVPAEATTLEVAVPPGGQEGVNMRSLVLTLIEIASAFEYLHRMGVVHCDLKPANVLLKSSKNDPRGFTAKVSDFGLSRVEDDGSAATFPFNSCGTAAYVAPEALTSCRKVTSSVDVYAFGILMWELFTMGRPYGDMKQQQMSELVVMRGLRPVFPTFAPASYVALATHCWCGAPMQRPTFTNVLASLNDMIATMDGRPTAVRRPLVDAAGV